MAIRFVDRPPTEIERGGAPSLATADHAPELIAEIFETPLVGAYTWSYEDADRKIRRLYELGKSLNWNATVDLDWSTTFPRDASPVDDAANPFAGYAPFEALSEADKVEFAWHNLSWILSQFLHGEQGALLVASQLVSCAPTHEAKLYAASQTFDEARHVEVFTRYLREKVALTYPVDPHLKLLLDKILTDRRWDLKFIGMQLIVEALALAAAQTIKLFAKDPLLQRLLEYVTRDESRHVAFGVTYMESFVKALPPGEVEARAAFAFEACVVMRERLVPTAVVREYGWPAEEGRKVVLDSPIFSEYRRFLFARVIPNLAKVGLLTDAVRPKYDELGVLVYENLVHDGAIDWAVLSAPFAGGAPSA